MYVYIYTWFLAWPGLGIWIISKFRQRLAKEDAGGRNRRCAVSNRQKIEDRGSRCRFGSVRFGMVLDVGLGTCGPS